MGFVLNRTLADKRPKSAFERFFAWVLYPDPPPFMVAAISVYTVYAPVSVCVSVVSF